jgi:hypothetical protein
MGLDLYASGGLRVPVFSVADGVVVQAGDEPNHGYGRHVYIEHKVGDITFFTESAHLRNISVKAGDAVSAGMQIATMGGYSWDRKKGVSGGPHLHIKLELPKKPVGRDSIKTFRDKYSVDPLPWLSDTFYPEPKYKGVVIVREGVKVRTLPETGERSVRIGALEYNKEYKFSEKIKDAKGNTWVKLLSPRPEWAAFRWGLGENKAVFLDLEELGPQAPGTIDPSEYIVDAELAVLYQVLEEVDALRNTIKNLILARE